MNDSQSKKRPSRKLSIFASGLRILAAWIFATTIFLLGGNVRCFGQYQFTTIDDPNGIGSTTIAGIDGANIVGNYTGVDGSNNAFLYSGNTYTPLTGIDGSPSTYAIGISGSNILGAVPGFHDYYLLSGSSYTNIALPSSYVPVGISGNNIVGQCNSSESFILTGTTFTYLQDPIGIYGTYAEGIYGDEVVGIAVPYWQVGFLFTGTSYVHLDDPSAAPIIVGADDDVGTMTYPAALDAEGIVGTYTDTSRLTNGFFLTGTTWTTVDDPLGSEGTFPTGISGNTIVGYYLDSSGSSHGFIATAVPEPGAFSFIVSTLGALFLYANLRRSSARWGEGPASKNRIAGS